MISGLGDHHLDVDSFCGSVFSHTTFLESRLVASFLLVCHTFCVHANVHFLYILVSKN